MVTRGIPLFPTAVGNRLWQSEGVRVVLFGLEIQKRAISRTSLRPDYGGRDQKTLTPR